MKSGHYEVNAVVKASGKEVSADTDTFKQYDTLEEAMEDIGNEQVMKYANRCLWIDAGNQKRAEIRTSGDKKKGKTRKTSFVAD